MTLPTARPKRKRVIHRTIHVEQTVELDEGQIRRQETMRATEEKDDQVTEVEREEIMDSTDETPWFSTGTRRTVKTVTPTE